MGDNIGMFMAYSHEWVANKFMEMQVTYPEFATAGGVFNAFKFLDGQEGIGKVNANYASFLCQGTVRDSGTIRFCRAFYT